MKGCVGISQQHTGIYRDRFYRSSLAVLIHCCFKHEVLVTSKACIAHDLPRNLFNIQHPHAKVLVTVPAAHSHVKALDESIGGQPPSNLAEPCEPGRT